MVLWEITLGTAYFLGLKRTYKLALRIQRKLISPKHPKIRHFVQRRTRNIFDVALRVHLKIQERDIEVGRNVGNWILRWLDRMKPSAQIRGPSPGDNSSTTSIRKQVNSSANQGGLPNQSGKSGDRESGRHLFSAARNMGPKPLSTINKIRPAGSNFQHRRYGTGGTELLTVKNYGKFGFGEVVRNDIRQYLMHH